MTLPPGTHLGAYEIVSHLGAGGMGDVYQAYDPRLGRHVAIKVLPDQFSTDADRLHRFEQEARAVAALNHPNIVAVYDVGQHAGAPYIVSELLEGESLRARLHEVAPPSRGAAPQRRLPFRTTIDCAIQIARGLAAAHGRGIVHRDLKPENIFVTPEGRVKVLDFGLAKLVQPAVPSGSLATIGVNTAAGVLLGTVGYMSPEQVRGQSADHRSDIFAFGAILYEMLAGRRAFQGASSADTMSAILNEDPPAAPLGEVHAPAGLARVVERCLDKSPDARFQSAHDLAFALDALSIRSDVSAGATVPARRHRRWLPWALATAALAVVAASALAVTYYRPPRETVGPIRFLVQPPEGLTFAQTALTNFIAVSPDGRRLVFAATDSSGTTSLWVRSLDSLEARALPGTEGGRQPFWSPDGRFLAFFASGSLKRIPADGGPAQILCEATNTPTGGTWSRAGVLLFSGLSGSVMRVSAAGGEPTPATTLDDNRQDERHSFPHFLPDGRRFLYYVRNPNPESNGIYRKSLDSDDARFVLRASSSVVYVAPGYLLYARDGVLLAQPFDPDRAEITGDPFPIAERVDQFPESGVAAFSSSQTGVLVYRGSAELAVSRLKWVDRTGRVLGEVGEPRPYRNPRLSPDGTQLVLELVDGTGNRDIWLMDVARGVPVRFTFDPGRDAGPVWSADGRSIAWQGNLSTYVKPSSGSGREEVLRNEPWIPDDWLPDGSGLLFHPNSPRQVWLLPLAGADRSPRPVIEGHGITTHARVSPDGRWVAFASAESGRFEVYVQNFPNPAGRWPVSTGGAIQPKWRRDGREIFFLGLDGRLMAAPIALGTLAETGKPQALFQSGIEPVTGFAWHQYDVAPDGQRFLVNAPETVTAPLTMIIDWPALVKP